MPDAVCAGSVLYPILDAPPRVKSLYRANACFALRRAHDSPAKFSQPPVRCLNRIGNSITVGTRTQSVGERLLQKVRDTGSPPLPATGWGRNRSCGVDVERQRSGVHAFPDGGACCRCAVRSGRRRRANRPKRSACAACCDPCRSWNPDGRTTLASAPRCRWGEPALRTGAARTLSCSHRAFGRRVPPPPGPWRHNAGRNRPAAAALT